MEVEVVEKKINGNSFKRQKLERTKGRRATLDSERRLSGGHANARRNDLLPQLQLTKAKVCDLKPSAHRTRITTPCGPQRSPY